MRQDQSYRRRLETDLLERVSCERRLLLLFLSFRRFLTTRLPFERLDLSEEALFLDFASLLVCDLRLIVLAPLRLPCLDPDLALLDLCFVVRRRRRVDAVVFLRALKRDLLVTRFRDFFVEMAKEVVAFVVLRALVERREPFWGLEVVTRLVERRLA